MGMEDGCKEEVMDGDGRQVEGGRIQGHTSLWTESEWVKMVRLEISGWSSHPGGLAAGAVTFGERSSTYLELKTGPWGLSPRKHRSGPGWGRHFIVISTKNGGYFSVY